MQKLLYIGHSYHNKTKSTQFLQNIFKEKYEIVKFDYDPYTDTMDKFKELQCQKFDVVILFQIMPSIIKLKEIIAFDYIAFFPMYDGIPPLNDPIWYEYKDCNIINFSKTLHDKCKQKGLSSYYIQYFPKPKDSIEDWGDEKSVFLWQRIERINPSTVEKIIGFKNINKFYHHQSSDPGHKIIETPEKYKNKVIITTWFETVAKLEQCISKSAIYIAPRKYEGIGMSFLDAMAMGRCVIAPNYPTMNEYIQNGKNGFLYNLKIPRRIKIKNILQIQKATLEFIKSGYQQWEANKYKILDWIISDVEQNRNIKLIEKHFAYCDVQKKKINISITYLTTKNTSTSISYYLFGFLPIYKKQKSEEVNK